MDDLTTLLTPTDCALLLIDQQAGLAFGVGSIDRQVLLENTTHPAHLEATKSVLNRRVKRREMQRRHWGREINGSHGDVNVLVMCFSLGIRIETRVWHMAGLPLLSLLEDGILAVQRQSAIDPLPVML